MFVGFHDASTFEETKSERLTLIKKDGYFGTVIYCRLSEFKTAKLEYGRLGVYKA
jgi:hypothetical protein